MTWRVSNGASFTQRLRRRIKNQAPAISGGIDLSVGTRNGVLPFERTVCSNGANHGTRPYPRPRQDILA